MMKLWKIVAIVGLVPYVFYGLVHMTGQSALTDAYIDFSWLHWLFAPVWCAFFFGMHTLAFVGGGWSSFPQLLPLFILSIYLSRSMVWLAGYVMERLRKSNWRLRFDLFLPKRVEGRTEQL